MEKLNIAEILRHCPKGMELDCTLFEDVHFDCIDDVCDIIKCYIQDSTHKTDVSFDRYGCYLSLSKAKYVIFPKGKTTWEGFQIPFKDGDIVFYNDTIAIFKEWDDETLFRTYVTKYLCCDSLIEPNVPLFGKGIRREARFATEEEKQKLFDAIKANGYKWNPETKTLEKLPKFKVGDVIQDEDGYKVIITKVNVEDRYYTYQSMATKVIGRIIFNKQNSYELVSNKFDITTLKPFSKVLVRQNVYGKWDIDFFGYYNKGDHHTTGPCIYKQCVPYEGNEHLLGTTDDCDEYYKTWE